MKITKESVRLYGVTDRMWLKGQTLPEQVKEAVAGGVTMIQLREKKLTEEELILLAREVKKVTDAWRIPFLINDFVSVAVSVDADGVHVGQEDKNAREVRQEIGPKKILGVSVHSVEEAVQAQKDGADYLGVGAVFPTDTKKNVSRITNSQLREIVQSVTIPVVAIGGINKNTIGFLKGSSIDGVAVVSALFAQKDIKKAARELRKMADEIVEMNKVD